MRYLAAMDESVSDGRFSSGGFVAPQCIWDDYLRPAWTERVLAGVHAGVHASMNSI